MPKTEAELYSRIVEINRAATHHRGLGSNYGYNAILDINLVRVCQHLRTRFPPPVRVLDIGCGDGYALTQLGESLAREGAAPGDFEFWGIGLNRYDRMYLEPGRFFETGVNSFDPGGVRFHLVISVFAFHYIWHKLESLERIYNDLLVDGGQAYLHFPGYLIRFGETPEAVRQNEADGNLVFQAFLSDLVQQGRIGAMQYRLTPQYSDDDDRSLLAEFGHLRFEKRGRDRIRFGRALQGFALFTRGFQFERMDLIPLTYVASHYEPRPDAPPPVDPPLPPCRITALTSEVAGRKTELDVAVHPFDGDTVILLCPGATESLAGNAVNYRAVAERVQRDGLGAVVRYGDPYAGEGDYADQVTGHLRHVLHALVVTAPSYCATRTPRVQVMAYSSSAGAIAALAADYDYIDALLLVAPSFDVPRERILPALRRFTGDLYVLIGSDDKVVMPRQAFWFYDHATAARRREYVEIPACGHNFEGPANQARLLGSVAWAFGGERPAGFPGPRSEATEIH